MIESIGEGAIRGKEYQLLEKVKGSLFQVCQYAEPVCLVLPEKTDPSIKHRMGDPETGTKPLHSPHMKKVLT